MSFKHIIFTIQERVAEVRHFGTDTHSIHSYGEEIKKLQKYEIF